MEGLAGLPELKNIDASHNSIPDLESIAEVGKIPTIEILDLRNNKIEKNDKFVEFF